LKGRRDVPVVGLVVLAVVALAAMALRLLIDRDLDGAISLVWPDDRLLPIRSTALIMGAIVGVSLAVSGVLLQALLRNPLASPFILGVSAGAGLGVTAAKYINYRVGEELIPESGEILPALGGAVFTLVLVWLLGRRRGWLDPVSLVLVGVVIATMLGALTMALQYMSPAGLHKDISVWMMGHIPESKPLTTLLAAGTCALVGVVVGVLLGRAMDAATLGDDEARSVGVSMGALRVWLFLLAGALAASAVAVAGPIGFVGLVAPHAARLVLGPRHGPLVIGAALLGVAIVVGADVARQAIDFGVGRFPIGIFTALIGGPVFIWLLRTGKGQS
jgi:iron complex transport system permease protein